MPQPDACTQGTRVQIPVYTDWWIRGARYGTVQREGRKAGGKSTVYVLLDANNRLVKVIAEDCEVVS